MFKHFDISKKIQLLKLSHPWGQLNLILLTTVLGLLLLGLYLPLPAPQMPVASEVYDTNHNLVTTFFLENRRPAQLEDIPAFLCNAFLAVEDHRFYRHHGINLGRIFKAAWHNLRRFRVTEGGSTITQQLAKNAYLYQKRSLVRKFKELFYTIKLELHLSKKDILELYLNQIYFGHGAYGVKVAAATYFGKELDQLNPAEMALLAGLPKGPAYYSPYNHPEAARRRLQEVLTRMLECNYISNSDYQRYRNLALRLPGIREATRTAPYFLNLLQNEVEQIFPKAPGLLYTGGIKIETTLDPAMQKLAENILEARLPKLITDKNGLIQPQAALIAVEPSSGEIKALIGGTDFSKSQFNRAIQAKRQPGSAFKPILYAAALANGYTLASQIDRAPKIYHFQSQVYQPLDDNNPGYRGNLSLRQALASSSNVVAVKLADKLGLKPVIDLAQRLGITSPLPEQLSLALGSGELTPLELTQAYIPLANGGLQSKPRTIRRILDQHGRVLYQANTAAKPVLNPGIAFLVTQALTGVFREGGTAYNVSNWLDRPAAGKTGTTEENRDAWLVGYTPDLLTCVFIGCDRNERPLPGAANRIAAPIWAEFMARALANLPAKDFIIPPEINKVMICKESGSKATSQCPAESEYFLNGTEPANYCQLHQYINLKVCRRSRLLPGPYCRRLREEQFLLGEQPLETCRECEDRHSLFELFRRLLRSR